MPDREKYIEILSKTAKTVKEFSEDTPIKISLECIEDILELLKEQEDLGTELTNAVELIHKKNERIEKLLKEQKFLVDSDGKITPIPVVVRCKDCRYGNLWLDEQVIVCDKLSKTRDKNWFCADGEKAVSE